MQLNKAEVIKEKNWLNNKDDVIKELSLKGYILSDPTRIKILLLLQKHGELCVTDIANIVGISISAVSHQLSKLEKMNLTKSVKMGKTVCYFPNKSIIKILKLINLNIQ